jgi:hypothetical protein
MKTEKNCLIIVVLTGILSTAAYGGVEVPLSNDKPFLIGQPYPELVGIKGLYFDIVVPTTEAKKNSSDWNKLKDAAESKLNEAGIEITTKFYNKQDMRCSQLRADVDMLKLEDSQQYIFCVQTSLARAVYLARDASWSVKADVWKDKRVMQAASVQDMPVAVSRLILKQVETFAAAWREANPPNKQTSDANDIGIVSLTNPTEQTKTNAESILAEYKYVASKNSKVFHKPGCRWAKNILPKNLVSYNSREEAIEDGKKPCSTCKP